MEPPRRLELSAALERLERLEQQYFAARSSYVDLWRIQDFTKILNVVLQLGAEFGSNDEVRLKLKFFEPAAHAFHGAALA